MSDVLTRKRGNDLRIDVAALTRQIEATHAATLEALDALVRQLTVAAGTADAGFDFPGLLKAAQQLLNLADLEIARLLKVSRPTIGRWVRGVSSPHPLARRAILEALAKKARSQIKAMRG